MEIPKKLRQELSEKLQMGEELSDSDKFVLGILIGSPSAVLKEEEEPRKVFYQKRKGQVGLVDGSKWEWEKIISKAIELVNARDKPITLGRLAKKCGIPTIGGNYTKFSAFLKDCKELEISRIGHKYMVASRGSNPSRAPTHHEPPMLDKDFRSKFLSERTKYYMRNSMLPYMEASHCAIADYSAFCKARKSGVTYWEFPKIDSVKPELIPILKDMLKDMARRGNKAGFNDFGYVLDLDARAYNGFVAELLLKSDQLAKSLGITKRLFSDGDHIQWR